MYSAFNTLQLELERLCLLRESIEDSGQADKELLKLTQLDNKITSHEKAIQLLIRHNQAEARQANKLHNHKIHKLGGGGLG